MGHAGARNSRHDISNGTPGAGFHVRSTSLLPLRLALALLRADVEIDPTAFVLDGFSLHSGLGTGHWRVDLGVFGMTVPEAVHGQDGFDLSFDGYGATLQCFLFKPQTGGFVGVDGGVIRARVALKGTELANTANTRLG